MDQRIQLTKYEQHPRDAGSCAQPPYVAVGCRGKSIGKGSPSAVSSSENCETYSPPESKRKTLIQAENCVFQLKQQRFEAQRTHLP